VIAFDPTAFGSRQRGVGLVEVMIGLTAGLLLIGVLAYFYLGGRQINRTHDDVSRMEASGRTALEIMGRAIRQAGARNVVTLPFTPGALEATEGAGGLPDTLTVRYDVQDGGEADCLGNNVPAGTVTYTFAIDTSNNTLTCTNGSGAAPQVVMDNIEDMQIDFGVDTDANGTIDAYQTATGLVPAQVTAVRVSLLARGPTEQVATGSQTFTYNGASVVKTDRHLRRVYASTFSVRNQAR
jgi:type IV pilus assembly protein PilW